LLNEANLLMSKVRDRESRTEGLESLLEARLEEVGEVKEELEEDKKKQDSAWTGIKNQQESVKRQSEFLARSIADFQAKVALMESDLASRKRKVELSEINIEARLDMVKRREEENTKEAKKLSDLRATLEREYKRRGIPF
jgi:Skp family chaperone for outer membrane proteins